MKTLAVLAGALLAAAILGLGSGARAAENDNLGAGALCKKCADRAFISSIGKCSECGRGTSSGAFKLCAACGKKLGKCQVCGAALAAEKPAEKKPEEPAKADYDYSAKAAVERWLKGTVKAQNELPPVAELADPALKTAFRRWSFFTLRFAQFPVARLAPEPLDSVNLFAADQGEAELTDGRQVPLWSITHLKSVKELQDFCKKRLDALAPGGDRPSGARTAAHGYCLLRKELAQDGFFKFEIKPEDFEVAEKDETVIVKASLKVVPGGRNSGAIEVTLTFKAKDGSLSAIEEQENLKAGMRPICQSLKLADPDPAVRAAAERDILIMGRNALPYLRGKIAETDGELREKIRALAGRIEAGEGGPGVQGGQPVAQ